MFVANFLIALREGVEASLIVGIIVATVVKTGRREVLPRLWLGVVAAAVVPLALGAWMTFGPYTLVFQAQEIVGGVLSLVAVGMLTWMIFWMGDHSRELSRRLGEDTSRALASGTGWAVVWIAIVSVGREGIETAIFVWSTVKATAKEGVLEPTLGVAAGLVVAIAIGWLVYRGSRLINLGAFFRVTGILLIVVAAGIVSYGLGDLQEAGVLPGWGISAYDLSGAFDGSIPWLSPSAWWFVLLEAMFNVNLSPTWLQVAGWVAYLVVVLPLFVVRSRSAPRDPARGDAASGVGAEDSAGCSASAASDAHPSPHFMERTTDNDLHTP